MPPASALRFRLAAGCTALWLLTALLFLPAAHNGFVNWDDQRNFLENSDYRSSPERQLRWVLTSMEAGFYMPVTRLSNAIDYRLWGMAPSGHHLSGVFLHACNSALFFLFAAAFFRLKATGPGGGLPQAALTALLFALHPLRVETVAWASGRHDLLSLFFYLLTALAYLRWLAEPERLRWKILSGFAFALGLLSKPTGMLMPAALAALDIHARGFTPFRQAPLTLLRGKAHLFALVVPVAIATLLGHHTVDSVYSIEKYGILNRLTQAAYGAVFYVWKTLLPLDLSPLYQIQSVPLPWDWPFWPACLAFLAVTALAWVQASRGRPGLLLAWGAYLLLLAPVSGLAQSGYQLAADRYAYFATLPLLLLAGGALANVKPALAAGAAGAAVACLAVLTHGQVAVWNNSVSLWEKAVAADPESTYALNNLGDALAEKGRRQEAIKHYERCVIINPGFAECQNDLATAYFETGQPGRAVRHLHFAVQAKPDYALAHHNLANIYFFSARRNDLALSHYGLAAGLQDRNPRYLAAYGKSLYLAGEHARALEIFEKALKLDPSEKTAIYGRGLSLQALGLDRAGAVSAKSRAAP